MSVIRPINTKTLAAKRKRNCERSGCAAIARLRKREGKGRRGREREANSGRRSDIVAEGDCSNKQGVHFQIRYSRTSELSCFWRCCVVVGRVTFGVGVWNVSGGNMNSRFLPIDYFRSCR